MTDKEMLNGIVVRAQTGVYYVQHNGRVLECVLRGKVKRELQTEDGKNIYKDPVAVGDNVLSTEAEGDKGAIEAWPRGAISGSRQNRPGYRRE